MNKLFIVVLMVVSLAACSSTYSGSLKYFSPTTLSKASPSAQNVTVGTFLDQRSVPPNWLGAIRGRVGQPLKNLESDRPVAELVKIAFTDGMRARGIAIDGASGLFQISGVIKKLECNQLVRREANVEIEITILDKQGMQRFVRSYTALNSEEGSPHWRASPDDLRATLEKTLSEVNDKALDDSALRAAMKL
jgi:uncharacterized lipoprotein YajG